MQVVVDSSKVITHAMNGVLQEFFDDHFKNGNTLYIHFDVIREVEDNLDEEEVSLFQALYKKGVKGGYIVDALHKYRLEKKFKDLLFFLRSSRPRLSLTDRRLIALACQVGADIDTDDGGIHRAMNILKLTPNKWRPYALQLAATSKKTSDVEQLRSPWSSED